MPGDALRQRVYSAFVREREVEVRWSRRGPHAAAALLVAAACWYGIERWSSIGDSDGAAAPQGPPAAALEAQGEALPLQASDEPSTTDRSRQAELAPPPAPSIEIPAPQVTTLRLYGRVVDDRTDRPLPGAAIEFLAHREHAPALVAHARSADDGSFDFTAIEDTSLQPAHPIAVDAFVPVMTIRLKGYAPLRCPPWKQGSLDKHLRDGTPHALADIRLTRGATLTGRVIADDDGRGIPGAVLMLSEDWMPIRGSVGSPFPIGHTDDHGAMVVEDRVPSLRSEANWLLVAVSPQGIGWKPLTVLDGRERIDDVEVRVFDHAPVSVEVVDGDGQPVEGAVVHAEPRFEPLREFISHSYSSRAYRCAPIDSFFSATCDADGNARFTALPLSPPDSNGARRSGRYNFVAEHPGFVRTWLTTDEQKVVAVRKKGPEHPVKIVMSRLHPCTLTGRVTDREQQGIPMVRITLDDGRSFACETDGRFKIVDLDASWSCVYLSATAPGFVRLTKTIERSATGDPVSLEFPLERPLPIEGRVVDEVGVAWSGVYVSARCLASRAHFATWTRTEVDGRFVLPDTCAGNWQVTCTAPFERNAWRYETTVGAIGGDRSVEIVLHRPTGAKLTASVVDAASGERLDPVYVSLMGGHDPKWIRCEVQRSAGAITADLVPPGDWRLWVQASGRATAYADFVVAEGETEVRVEVDAGLAKGALAVHLVFDESTRTDDWDLSGSLKSMVGMEPSWDQGKNGCRLYGARRDAHGVALHADGVLHFDGLTPGRWTLRFVGQNIHNEMDVDVAPGRETAVEMAARPSATLHFISDVDADDIMMRVDVVRADGTREPQFSGLKAQYGRCTYDVPVEHGSYHWTAHFERKDDSGRRAEIAELQSGELSVAHGEKRRIDVQFVRR